MNIWDILRPSILTNTRLCVSPSSIYNLAQISSLFHSSLSHHTFQLLMSKTPDCTPVTQKPTNLRQNSRLYLSFRPTKSFRRVDSGALPNSKSGAQGKICHTRRYNIATGAPHHQTLNPQNRAPLAPRNAKPPQLR